MVVLGEFKESYVFLEIVNDLHFIFRAEICLKIVIIETTYIRARIL